MDRFWLKVRKTFYDDSWKVFAGLSVMIVADLLELPSVREKLIFSQFSNKYILKYLLGLQLWHLIKYAELTEVVSQNDKLFIKLLNEFWVDNNDDDVKPLVKIQFIH